jgi:broad specificity phosphatase PhoE
MANGVSTSYRWYYYYYYYYPCSWLIVVVSLMLVASSTRCGGGGGAVAAAAVTIKDVWILRHGQAVHNPRAEEAQRSGCSHEHFLELMRQDDCLDAPLTLLGQQQATAVWNQHGRYHWSSSSPQPPHHSSSSYPELVVSSPLTRALQTAELALGSSSCSDATSHNSKIIHPNRVCYEGFREINGWLLNAQRQSKSALQQTFWKWNFDHLATEHDSQWEPETLEDVAACAERGFAGLRWLAARPETSILLVAHGGILRYALSQHPNVVLKDARTSSASSIASAASDRSVQERFHNCELRRYRMECPPQEQQQQNDSCRGPILVLTEIDLDHKLEQHPSNDEETCFAKNSNYAAAS